MLFQSQPKTKNSLAAGYHILKSPKNVQLSYLQIYYPDVTWTFMPHCFQVTRLNCNSKKCIILARKYHN